jgi:hypothetical protein
MKIFFTNPCKNAKIFYSTTPDVWQILHRRGKNKEGGDVGIQIAPDDDVREQESMGINRILDCI